MSVKIIPEKIHLIDFQIVRAEIYNPDVFNDSEIEAYKNNFDFKLAFNFEEKKIRATLIVDVETVSFPNKNISEAKIHFELNYFILVENLEDLSVLHKNNQLELKLGLGNTIASIVYSTSRGVLMTRLQGTSMSKYIMPVIDPNSLTKNHK
jgi:hypothetical protein